MLHFPDRLDLLKPWSAQRPRSAENPGREHVATLRERGASWPQIAKQLGVGVGTAHRAYQELSKKPEVDTLSRNPVSMAVAAD
jgi:hypothetical protein